LIARISVPDEETWNKTISSLPYTHILQSYRWGEVKALYGWKPHRFVWKKNHDINAAALILEKTISIQGLAPFLRVMYVPKGPLLMNWEDQGTRIHLINEIRDFARERRAIFIKIDPDIPEKIIDLNTGKIVSEPESGCEFINDLYKMGWVFSKEQIQFRNTILLDLRLSEDELLNQMKPKTRYNIRLAQRKGVLVRSGNILDIEMLYKMYAETAKRDKFTIRDQKYYQSLWGNFINQMARNSSSDNQSSKGKDQFSKSSPISYPIAQPLIAEVEGQPVAAVIYYQFARKAWYLFGMSRDIHREKMPNHLLQWEAICRSKAAGCETLDFWGAPEVFDNRDQLYGVYRFKAGFGGKYIRHIGAWDYPLRPFYYRIYMEALPKLLSYMRWRARDRIIREITTF
jgi:lipid II:glycine glycyltransferase (peptidoglycan interpeptide bridge formation enzyme)